MKKKLCTMSLLITMVAAASALWAKDDSSSQMGNTQAPGALPSDNGYQSGTPQTSDTVQTSRVIGTVESVDSATNEVTVRSDIGDVQIYKLSSNAQISNGQNTIKISDIKAGDSVTVVQNAQGQVVEVLVAPAATVPPVQ